MSEPSLRLGPILRYVNRTEATVWVETDRACTVTITLGAVALGSDGQGFDVQGSDAQGSDVQRSDAHGAGSAGAPGSVSAPTWSVHGHHYALLQVTGLEPGTVTPYAVSLDGTSVWPEPDSDYPPSVIRTLSSDATMRLSFGSCRRVAPFDEEGLDAMGADALAALATRMQEEPYDRWPDTLFMAGDQIYADEPSPETVERLRVAHADASPGRQEVREEVWNFEEYTWLYAESWSPAPVRWLLSTVPTCMLLDDHDLRDDWNTSLTWREEVTQAEWWRDRVVGAFGSYWVYQHLGNLSPEALAQDPLLAQLQSTPDEATRTAILDDFAWRADAEVGAARWSFVRDFGDEKAAIRLVAMDCRASRDLSIDHRVMVDDGEWEWIVEQATARPHGAPIVHLMLGATLPLLLPRGIHHLEGWNKAAASGTHGRLVSRAAEWVRQAVDLEHWSAFRTSFARMAELLRQVTSASEPPASVLFLSGDVHCSYTAQARLEGQPHPRTVIQQLTMSPFRNALPLPIKLVNKACENVLVRTALRGLSRTVAVPDTGLTWSLNSGPWFRNGVMTIVFDGATAVLEVDSAAHTGTRQYLERAAEQVITG